MPNEISSAGAAQKAPEAPFDDSPDDLDLFGKKAGEKWRLIKRFGQTIAGFAGCEQFDFFDAGAGECIIFEGVRSEIHLHLGTIPVFGAAREIDAGNLINAFPRIAKILKDNPLTVAAFTNVDFKHAPFFTSPTGSLTWDEFPLTGDPNSFETQIHAQIGPFLGDHWQTRKKEEGGIEIVEPSAFTLFHTDYQKELERRGTIPKTGSLTRCYDAILASHSWALRRTPEFKTDNIVVPLTSALKPGGVLMVCHYTSDGDAAAKLIREILPGHQIFNHTDEQLLVTINKKLPDGFRLTAPELLDYTSIRFSDREEDILAAFKAVAYTTQISVKTRDALIASRDYVEPTRQFLDAHDWTLNLRNVYYEIWRASP